MSASPWASGPGEILQHGLSLLQKDSDVNRRLAMISIDNAVELMVKTFLGLPKRVTGLQIGRDKFREISESFPKLLDALEEHASEKLSGVDLGIIEWYHRLRNELYHQGNGLTVERDKVEVYAELAKLLFKNLFGVDLPVKESQPMEILGTFMAAWSRIERAAAEIAMRRGFGQGTTRMMPPLQLVRTLEEGRVISVDMARDLDEMRRLRNNVAHGMADHKTVLTPQVVACATRLAAELERLATESPQA
jgi:HAMP domain-containing protein